LNNKKNRDDLFEFKKDDNSKNGMLFNFVEKYFYKIN